MKIENAKIQMRKGVLELCILSIIAEKEAYPSDIIERLEESKLSSTIHGKNPAPDRPANTITLRMRERYFSENFRKLGTPSYMP